MIYEVYVIGNMIPNATDPLKKINITGGLEIDMAKMACKVLCILNTDERLLA